MRGKGRDQLAQKHIAEVEIDGQVSVPLRGKGRDQLHGPVALMGFSYIFPFPSPCGEKVGINVKIKTSLEHPQDVSVPLRGKGRDQRLKAVSRMLTMPSFRPLAGKR